MRRLSLPLFAAGLLGYPVCILAYWWLTPAYGELNAARVLASVVGHSTSLAIGNAFAFVGCLLSIPAALAYMAAIGDRSPKLALIGGAMSIVGWVAVLGTLVLDPVAIQFVAHGAPSPDLVDLFVRISNSPTIIAFEALAALHLVGGILIGIGFWRARLVPRWAALILIAGGPIHFVSNIAGILIVDSLTWIALVAANVPVISLLGTGPRPGPGPG